MTPKDIDNLPKLLVDLAKQKDAIDHGIQKSKRLGNSMTTALLLTIILLIVVQSNFEKVWWVAAFPMVYFGYIMIYGIIVLLAHQGYSNRIARLTKIMINKQQGKATLDNTEEENEAANYLLEKMRGES